MEHYDDVSPDGKLSPPPMETREARNLRVVGESGIGKIGKRGIGPPISTYQGKSQTMDLTELRRGQRNLFSTYTIIYYLTMILKELPKQLHRGRDCRHTIRIRVRRGYVLQLIDDPYTGTGVSLRNIILLHRACVCVTVQVGKCHKVDVFSAWLLAECEI
uniref:SFRICE_028477 n=1 Tax=Spodoptera frugiperda TaxID=7108 RepID=A0A2H1VSI5_SPOFR